MIQSLRFRVAATLVIVVGYQHALAQDTSPSGATMDGIAWDCSGWHTVVSGDTCYSIEQQYGITEAEFLAWNPAVSSDCGTNFWPDYSYCVRVGAPGPTMEGIANNCDAWHTVVSGDSCYSIEQEYSITADQFFEWNPAVSTDCATNFWPDYSYCVGINENQGSTTSSVPSATVTSTAAITSSTRTSVNTTTTPYSTRYPVTSFNLTAPYTATALPPQRTLSGQPSYCNAWHMVAGGQTCEDVVNYYSNRLTFDQLLEYNPTIGQDCSGLYTGWYICVGIQSQTSSRIEWYTSQTNFTAPASTPYPGYVATAVANYTASPQQTGIPTSCQNYYQAQADDTCTTVLDVYDYITEEQFFSWNPALNGDCLGLWSGYYYCVANFAAASDIPMPPTVTSGASPTATGTISTCEKWYITRVNDDCATVAAWFGTFSESDFISWNPSVGSSCANIQQDTYYCVGVPGTATTRSNAVTTTVPASMPTQTGVVSGCTQFWLVSPSDTCDTIIEDSGVANATIFHAWNPAVGSDCAGLKVDYYVCVSTSEWETIAPISTVTISAGQTIVPSTTVASNSASASASSSTTSSAGASTTTSTAVTTPSPFMPGMVDGCVRFYFRGSDAAALYCYDIASYAGIALSDFYTWNPQVGTDCTNLWADTWYCIGLSGSTPTTISSGVPTPA
ncbi:hypothetical protein N0V92_006176 [Colletotrichum tropicale]|nr:hypothetical protein N0V92_006176 [Colletotrichum tropicale]